MKQHHKTETGYNYRGIAIHAAPGLHEHALEVVRKHCRPDGSVLDLGCGSGAFTKRLQDNGFRTMSVDLSLDTFGLDSEHREIDFNSAFADQFESDHFDAIVALEVIEHLENPLQFLRQLKELCRPECAIIISFPNLNMYFSLITFFREGTFGDWNRSLYWETGHQTVMPAWLFEEHLRKTGLTLVEKHFCAPLVLPANFRRYLYLAFIRLVRIFSRNIRWEERRNEAVLFVIRNDGAASPARSREGGEDR